MQPQQARPRFNLDIQDQQWRLGERTLIMAVLNVTPDSFSDGGRFMDPTAAIRHAVQLAKDGADWIDVGGESTRPGAPPVPAAEEMRRVLPVIRGLRRRLPGLPISIDTTKSLVAEAALDCGANVINDVSGLRFDRNLAVVARRTRAPLILTYMRGRPATMQTAPFARRVWPATLQGLRRSIARALQAGVARRQLIVDPGLGFGKSRLQNYQLLASLERLQALGLPVLVGASRKSFIQAAVAGAPEAGPAGKSGGSAQDWPVTALRHMAKSSAAALDFGDAAAVVAAALHGAHLVRVHQVRGAVAALRVADAILAALPRRSPSRG